MKTIRRLMTVAGVSLALLTLGVTGAKSQDALILSTTNLRGRFTLPNNAQWGKMSLPAGDYTFHYGRLFDSLFVEVRGMAKGSPHGVIAVMGDSEASAAQNELVCVRQGDSLVVRALEMPQIDKAAEFAMQRGAKLASHQGKRGGYTQLAEAPMLIQRIAVTLNAN